MKKEHLVIILTFIIGLLCVLSGATYTMLWSNQDFLDMLFGNLAGLGAMLMAIAVVLGLFHERHRSEL